MSTLYIVATPIGNLEDITLRAIRVLKEVDLILCEDTRVTKHLLKRYDVTTKVESYHAQSTSAKTKKIIDLLSKGTNIALVSDAGTPLISDPGVQLIDIVIRDLGNEVAIVPIPGASALTAAISVAGIGGNEFSFLGFVPHKKGRETFFKGVAVSEIPVVFYESPHRILKALESLTKVLSENKKVIVARELTKIHEEIVRGTPGEVYGHFLIHPDRVRGEFVVIVA
jgi:16S rRNA (cytidine1402-2'-O)-methyltransferase